MGSKIAPGAYDCYEAAEPDEPMFVLLARDPLSPILVRLWAGLRSAAVGADAKTAEASECADAMDAWHREHRP